MSGQLTRGLVRSLFQALARGLWGFGLPQSGPTALDPDPYSLNDGDPPLSKFTGADVICEHDGATWGAQGSISNGTLSGAIEVEAGANVTVVGVAFSGAARDVIRIENTESADPTVVNVAAASVPAVSTIVGTAPANIVLTVDGAAFALPFEFRDYYKVVGDASQVYTTLGDAPYYAG